MKGVYCTVMYCTGCIERSKVIIYICYSEFTGFKCIAAVTQCTQHSVQDRNTIVVN